MPYQEWKDEQFDLIFNAVYTQIQMRRVNDPTFSPPDLEGLLEAQYIQQGNDWTGRGELGHITDTATIAAYETCLAEWRKEIEEEGNPNHSSPG